MPLDFKTIHVPFGGGIDTKTDKKLVIPGKLLALENGVFRTSGAIRKRNGFDTPYSDQTVGWYAHDPDTIIEGSAIYRRGRELLKTARQTNESTGLTNWEDGWYVYSHDSQNDRWKNIGTRQPLALGVETIVEPTLQWAVPDVALAGNAGFACYGWMAMEDPADSTTFKTVRITIIELQNNTTIIDQWVSDVSLTNRSMGGVHVTGIDATNSVFYVWIADPANGRIYLSMTDVTDMATLGLPVVKIDDYKVGSYLWDVCTATLTGSGECSVVAYEDTNADIKVRWFNEWGNLVNTQTIDDDPKGAITVFEAYDDQQGANKVVVAWQSTADGKLYGQTYNANGTPYAGPYPLNGVDLLDRVRNITGCRDTASDFYTADSSFCKFFVEYANDNANTRPDLCQVLQIVCEFDGTNLGAPDTMRRCCLGSKAWEYEDKARVWVVHDSLGLLDDEPETWNPQLQNTYFLRSTQGSYQIYAAGTGDRTDARCLGGRASGQSQGDYSSLSAVVSPEVDTYLFAGLRKDVITNTETGESYDSVVGISTKFGQIAQSTTEMGSTTQTGGGFVGDADGRFQELGFHLYPESLIATVTTLGAGPAVTWQYVVVYEWTDREGQIHRSAPSIPIQVSCQDTDNIAIEVACLHQGDPERLTKTRCVLYRPLDGPGPVFYRLPDETPLGADSPHEFNNIDADTVTLYDSNPAGAGAAAADDVIAQNESLYTTGGVAENNCPPATSIMNVRQDRVFLVPDEDRTAIWFSKSKQTGVGVSFSGYFTKRISDGGPITALASMDTREIVFKESEIRAFSGNGPIDTGVGSFGEDYLITTDVGCVDRASVVWTDKGIMFKSLKGIYLLGRNLQVSYIGAPVEDYNQYRVIKAELVENKHQVRFLLEGSQMLVFDYSTKQWSVFKAPQTGETEVFWDTVDSAIWQNQYVMTRDDGVVFLEGTDFTDGTDYIPLTIDTAWVKPAGLQGYQRIRKVALLGDIYGQCEINFEVYYNYVDADVDLNPQIESLLVDAGFAALPPAQMTIRPKMGFGKSQSLRLRIYDSPAAGWLGTQEGYSMTSLALEAGFKKGIMRTGMLKKR